MKRHVAATCTAVAGTPASHLTSQAHYRFPLLPKCPLLQPLEGNACITTVVNIHPISVTPSYSMANMAEVSLHTYCGANEHFGQNTAEEYFVTWLPYPKMCRTWEDLVHDLNIGQNMNGRDTQE